MSYQNAEADRRISQMLQVGTIESVEGDSVRVRIGDVLTHPIPTNQMRAGAVHMRSIPTPGEQVLVAAPGGDMSQAMVATSLAASEMPADQGQGVVLDLGGGNYRINGGVIVTGGDIIVNGGDVVADGISLKHHVHGGVMAGAGDTGKPK